MALLEYKLKCDGCGAIIDGTKEQVFFVGDKDFCRSCRDGQHEV